MPKARPWPNNALHAKRCAEEAFAEIAQMLEPLIHNGNAFDRTETLRRQARALAAAQSGLIALMKVDEP